MSQINETFEKEIKFLEPQFSTDDNGFVEVETKKTAVFKELSRTDRAQHKLHFFIIGVFNVLNLTESEGIDKKVASIDPDKLYDLTRAAVEALMVVDGTIITEADKKLFLNDSAGLVQFGLWYLREKITPFFVILIRN